MSTKIRESVKKLSHGKELEQALPEYLELALDIHDSHARLKFMMEYYVFYEMITEGINPYINTAEDIAQALHQAVRVLMDPASFGEEERSRQRENLLKLRTEVTDRMQVLTAYVDRFVVYEYILNRMQYRFEDQEVIAEDSVFAQEVLNFIFATKDNMAINDNIRMVIGQLPMRMTRSHYFDLIRESISVYKGSDKSALEGHLYMFRTNAMLYRTDDMEKYFTEFVPVIKEFDELDYENMTAEMYQIYAEKLRTNASKLNDISDLYMLIQKLINGAYSMYLADGGQKAADKIPAAQLVIRGINELFLHEESAIWEKNEEHPLESEEDKLYWLGEHFPEIEGMQEQIYESMTTADAVLEETIKSEKEQITKLGLMEGFTHLQQLMQLASGSDFVELEWKDEEEKVTAQDAEKAAEQIVTELKQEFKGQSRLVRRAIMANTLEKIPVFFSTPQEVADYISQSLMLCDDEAEKYASKQLIQEMMG